MKNQHRPGRPGTDNNTARSLLDEIDAASAMDDRDESVEVCCGVRQKAERAFADGSIEGADMVDIIDFAAAVAEWLGARAFSKVSHAPLTEIENKIARSRGRAIGRHLYGQALLRGAVFGRLVETIDELDDSGEDEGGLVLLRAIYPVAEVRS